MDLIAQEDSLRLMAGLAAGLAVACVAIAGAVHLMRKNPAWRRVDDLGDASQPVNRASLSQQLRASLTNLLTRLAGPSQPKQAWQMTQLRKTLVLAGFRAPGAVSVYLGLRALAIMLMPSIVMLTPLSTRLRGAWLPIFLAVAAGVGYLLPGLILEWKGRGRANRISRELPDVLDLMVICVEAGLGLDAAIKRVAHEVRLSAPILAAELTMVSLELKAGIPRDMALKNLAYRCGVDDVSSLCAMLNQADRFGVSVGRSLRIHSDTVRTKRRQKMEEAAAKVPLKLLFPVLFMIFPAIMVVMGGPAIIRISESIMK
jgi:tight adherence protein C